MGISVERTGIVEECAGKRGFFDRFRYRPARLAEHDATRIEVNLTTGERRIEKLAAEAIEQLTDEEIRKRVDQRRDEIVKEIIERHALKAAERRIEEIVAPPTGPRISDIIRTVAEVTGAPASEICGASRQRRYTHPRFLACKLIKTLRTDLSLEAIGMVVGNRHHTTIKHALQEFDELHETPAFARWLADPRIIELQAA